MPVNPGEVEIELSGRKEILRPTLDALLTINALGGVMGAYGKLQSYDFNAYVAIIAAGLGKKPRDIQDEVFRAGFVDFVEPLCDFVDSVSRGGKPKNDDGKKPSGEA